MTRALVAFAVVESASLVAATASAVLELIRSEPLRYGKLEARIHFAPGEA